MHNCIPEVVTKSEGDQRKRTRERVFFWFWFLVQGRRVCVAASGPTGTHLGAAPSTQPPLHPNQPIHTNHATGGIRRYAARW